MDTQDHPARPSSPSSQVDSPPMPRVETRMSIAPLNPGVSAAHENLSASVPEYRASERPSRVRYSFDSCALSALKFSDADLGGWTPLNSTSEHSNRSEKRRRTDMLFLELKVNIVTKFDTF